MTPTEQEILHRVPPQNLEAEQAVLGAALLDNSAFPKILEVIKERHFYREAHRKVFSAMLELFERNEPIDLLTLTDRLRKSARLEDVGGESYLAALVDAVPTAAGATHHARLVKEKALLRDLISAATEIVARGYEGREDAESFIDQAERVIFEISQDRISQSFISMSHVLKSTFKTIEELYERKELVTGVPAGFTDFDRLTAGLQPADLVIIAGRPSMGKTAFALSLAQNVGTMNKLPVGIFSLEMSKEQLVIRLLCALARIDIQKLRTGYLDKGDWPRLTTATGKLTEAPIYIDDSAALTALDIRARARRLKAERGLDLIIVDYLQLIRGRDRSENRQQEITEITRSLKELAKELHIPVVALSQLSRQVEHREGHRPQLADLRESGAIEQDADVVVFIYRPEVYERDEERRSAIEGQAEIIIAKQRNGPIGNVPVTFIKEYARFESISRREDSVSMDEAVPF
ncbi:MAG: replicative DNA helicase [Nitrospinota bacterium]